MALAPCFGTYTTDPAIPQVKIAASTKYTTKRLVVKSIEPQSRAVDYCPPAWYDCPADWPRAGRDEKDEDMPTDDRPTGNSRFGGYDKRQLVNCWIAGVQPLRWL